jgi:putative transposase
MGRQPQLTFKGAIYHVVQRGNNKEYIFKKQTDKNRLLELLKSYRDILDYDCLGYVIMDNHYHVILRTNGMMISKVMHRINTEFAKAYNRQYKRSGHVFEKRYKGILVKDDKYLLSLLRYVHQNPLKAKMCQRICDYKWSSDVLYRYGQNNKGVQIELILDMFSNDRKKALVEYAKFMDADNDEKSEVFEDTQVIGDISNSYQEWEANTAQESMDDILKRLSDEKEFTLIKQSSRKRALTLIKKKYVEACLKNNYTMIEIGANIGISQPAVTKLIKQEV